MIAAKKNSIINISKVIQNAVVFNLANWNNKNNQMVNNSQSLTQDVADLFKILHLRSIDYVLVGGIALLQYIEGRNTEDIDIIMSLPLLKTLPEIKISSQDINFVRGKFENLKIDILLTTNPLFKKVQDKYSTIRTFAEQNILCATVEGLLILKLYALPSLYRQGNFARVGIYENDIATLINAYNPDVKALFKELSPHLRNTDISAIGEVIKDIKKRIKRFNKKLN